jgi:enamine deaminase RidA (YjgF/YER057c/UK114 family)
MIERFVGTDLLHRVVEHNGTLYLSGIGPSDVSVGMRAQSEQVFAKAEAILDQHGSSKAHILSVIIFLTDLSRKLEMNEAWTSWLAPAEIPARAAIGVNDLAPDMLIEACFVAARA